MANNTPTSTQSEGSISEGEERKLPGGDSIKAAVYFFSGEREIINRRSLYLVTARRGRNVKA